MFVSHGTAELDEMLVTFGSILFRLYAKSYLDIYTDGPMG